MTTTRTIGIYDIAKLVRDTLRANKTFIQDELIEDGYFDAGQTIDNECIYVGKRRVIPYDIYIQVIPGGIQTSWFTETKYDIKTTCQIQCGIKTANLIEREGFLGIFEACIRTILNDPRFLTATITGIGEVYDSFATNASFGVILQNAIYAANIDWFGSMVLSADN